MIATEKAKKDRPFTVATRGMIPLTNEGVERSDLELAGDVAGKTIYMQKTCQKLLVQ